MQDGPKLLIDWEPRGEGFLRSLGPAFSRSDRRLLIEVDRAPRPKRPIVLSYLLHAAIIVAVTSAPVRESMHDREFVSPVDFHPEHYEIVYLPSHELPQMKDAGGTPSGSHGAAGGAALHTPQQVIRIARGNPVIPHVVDAPKLILPPTEAPANLLVSSAPAPSVPANATQREKIMTVQAFAATSVVPPVPQVVRERVAATPLLPINPIPPPVSTPARDTLAGSKLELPTSVVPPPTKPKRDEAATLAAIKAGVPPPDIKQVNIGSIAPPPVKDTSVVVSSQPGDSVGQPTTQSPGAIAMSTTGAGKPGIGEGTGTSIGHGASTGAATKGGGTGATTAGIGSGDVSVQTGISPGTGPGGGGAGMIASAIPGVTISGGKVMLPSFGSTSPVKTGGTRLPSDDRNVRPVTIVATASAGGAVSARGLLKGAKVYTIYIDTSAGLAFLQFAERVPDDQRDLTAPEPLISKVPSDLRSARVLLAGVMDRNGSLRNLRIVEAGSRELAENLIDAVQRWHFRPALRGDDPVEVDAIFGLNVDTR